MMPSYLISFSYLRLAWDKWAKCYRKLPCASWCLDSGAFTAHTLGKPIDVHDYADAALFWLGSERPPSIVFSLDVIGDWKASQRNTSALLSLGVPVVPAYHLGSPPEVLRDLCEQFPYIALGGIALATRDQRRTMLTKSFEIINQASKPPKVHGFGVTAKDLLLDFPLTSCDSSSWYKGISHNANAQRAFPGFAPNGRNRRRLKARVLVELMVVALHREMEFVEQIAARRPFVLFFGIGGGNNTRAALEAKW